MPTALELLHDLALPRPVLAICHRHDDGYLAVAATHQAALWARTAGLPQPPQAWPDDGLYPTVLLPLPANRETLSFCLAAACSHLAPGGTLYLFGQNDAGIKSAGKPLQQYFSDVALLAIGGHGRLYAARQPLRCDYRLDDVQHETALPLTTTGLTRMLAYPGLFAKGGLDVATALLLEHLPALPPQAAVLDFACGIGIIAKAVELKQPQAVLTVVDNDALALAAAARNVPGTSLQCLAHPSGIAGAFDLVVSNPPIHDGQVQSHAVVEQLIAELPRLLKPYGAALIVTQVTVPVARLALQTKLAATEVAANRSFRVTRVSRP